MYAPQNPPPRGRTSGGLVLALVAAVILLVVTLVFALAMASTASADGDYRDVPRTRVTLAVVGDSAPDTAALRRLRELAGQRVRAAGLGSPIVTVDGDQIVVTVGGRQKAGRMRSVFAFGDLSFRKVLATTPSSGEATSGPSTAPVPSRDDVAAKLGEAYGLAGQASSPVEENLAEAAFATFATLTPAEVAALPAAMQFNIPTVDCGQLDARPVDAPVEADGQFVACDRSQGSPVKYLLAAPSVAGSDVDDAKADYEPAGGGWQVTISFTGTGQDKWTALTEQTVGQQVAITLDNTVLSAPTIQSVITGDAVISGRFTRDEASTLAAQISTGALPVPLTVVNVRVF